MGMIKYYMILNENTNCSIEIHHMDYSSFEARLFSQEKYFFLLFLSQGTIYSVFNHDTYQFHSPGFICFDGKDSLKLIKVSNDADLYLIKFTKDLAGYGSCESTQSNNDPTSIREAFYLFRMAPFITTNKTKKRCILIHESLVPKCLYWCEQLERTIKEYQNKTDKFAIIFYFEQLLAALTSAVNGYEIELYTKSYSGVVNDFQKIQEYIDKHLNESLTLRSISKRFFVSVSSIERKFSTYCGMTFKTYVSMKRLEQAKRQLAYTTLSHKEIAANIGFSYTQSFSTFFKNMSGMAPGEYRKLSQRNIGMFPNV